ncbi:MAG: MBOAT family protein [Bacteroidales bacterium]|nr:hypothetical protein [Saprospiraceae bacterium]MCF8381925.1 MBOAT family protein [Bacteroidales bacterium]
MTTTGVGIFYFLSNATNIKLIPNTNPILLNIIAPIGISYISFQAIGYLIEIYRGNHPPEKNIGIFASYVMFFPKLLSGPIERAHNFIPQLYKKHEFEYQQTVDGLKLVAWGFFKKLVIADRIAILTDQVFNNVQQYTGIPLIIAVLLFTVQLYADFSGYTDIALGIAQTLGFKLMNNFNIPFVAKSTKELWRRWHISLSTWFNDYVFNTIVINRRDWNKWAIVYATIVTFLILGLWHGSSWNFVIFGFVQGLILSLEFLTMKIRKRLRSKIPVFLNNSFGIIFTFFFFSFALIFFRANNFSDAIYTISHLFDIQFGFNENLGIEGRDIYLIPVLVFFLFFIQFLQIKGSIITRLSRKPVYFRWMLYCTLLLSILFFGLFSKSSYIYLQF